MIAWMRRPWRQAPRQPLAKVPDAGPPPAPSPPVAAKAPAAPSPPETPPPSARAPAAPEAAGTSAMAQALPPALAAAVKAGRRPTLAVTVLGLAGDSLDSVLTLVGRECKRQGIKPVFITDQMDLALFRSRKLVVDQVVDVERRARDVPELPWRSYLRGQCALLARRWQFEAVIGFGRRLEPDCLEALQPAPSSTK